MNFVDVREIYNSVLEFGFLTSDSDLVVFYDNFKRAVKKSNNMAFEDEKSLFIKYIHYINMCEEIEKLKICLFKDN